MKLYQLEKIIDLNIYLNNKYAWQLLLRSANLFLRKLSPHEVQDVFLCRIKHKKWITVSSKMARWMFLLSMFTTHFVIHCQVPSQNTIRIGLRWDVEWNVLRNIGLRSKQIFFVWKDGRRTIGVNCFMDVNFPFMLSFTVLLPKVACNTTRFSCSALPGNLLLMLPISARQTAASL